jgi:hypothetical protein
MQGGTVISVPSLWRKGGKLIAIAFDASGLDTSGFVASKFESSHGGLFGFEPQEERLSFLTVAAKVNVSVSVKMEASWYAGWCSILLPESTPDIRSMLRPPSHPASI